MTIRDVVCQLAGSIGVGLLDKKQDVIRLYFRDNYSVSTEGIQ